ncbi:MAG: hypothetical protein IPP33_09385 [Flavobacteriales bacterium]|nr:hypothetical protein [Flavobacteriales bacterium]
MRYLIPLFCTLASSLWHDGARAQVPDYYGDAYSDAVGYWANQGQCRTTLGNPCPTVLYYSQNAYPAVKLMTESKVRMVVAKRDTLLDVPDTLYAVDIIPTGELAQLVTPEGNTIKSYTQNFYLPQTMPGGVEQVEGFDRVEYSQIFPGIDWHFYTGSGGQKMSFVCAPNSNPEINLRLKFTGQNQLNVDWQGTLRVLMQDRWVELREAVAYQLDEDNNIVPLNWTADWNLVNNAGVVNFVLDEYDPTKTLVLQVGPPPLGGGGITTPGVCYSTYFGGGGLDVATGVEQGADEWMLVGGHTTSDETTIPEGPGVYYTPGDQYAMVEGFNDLNQLQWISWLGGNHQTKVRGLACKNASGEVYIAGATFSTNFFTLANGAAYFNSSGAAPEWHGYIAKFAQLDGTLIWSTYFGTLDVEINGLDVLGNKVLVAGRWGYLSTVLPTIQTSPIPGSTTHLYAGGNSDAFVALFDEQDQLQWRTFIGSAGVDEALDVEGSATKFAVVGNATVGLPLVDGGTLAYDQIFDPSVAFRKTVSSASSACLRWSSGPPTYRYMWAPMAAMATRTRWILDPREIPTWWATPTPTSRWCPAPAGTWTIALPVVAEHCSVSMALPTPPSG